MKIIKEILLPDLAVLALAAIALCVWKYDGITHCDPVVTSSIAMDGDNNPGFASYAKVSHVVTPDPVDGDTELTTYSIGNLSVPINETSAFSINDGATVLVRGWYAINSAGVVVSVQCATGEPVIMECSP
jgi:hypothetical protein